MDTQFVARPADAVAPDLLGCHLVHEAGDMLRGRIVEAEAYGPDDPASHAASGRTEWNAPMFGEPGTAYVYLAYGLHTLLNVVTGEDGVPSAVLIRAVEPLEGVEAMRERRGVDDGRELCSGPGKVCEAFGVMREQNAVDMTAGRLRIERQEALPAEDLATDTRIGISAGTEREHRFYEHGNPHVSH